METQECAAKELGALHLTVEENQILKILCRHPETGVKSSELQKQIHGKDEGTIIDKATYYKHLKRLTDGLNIVERMPGPGKDLRQVNYRIRPGCLRLCVEITGGHDIRQKLDETDLRSIVTAECDGKRNADCVQRHINTNGLLTELIGIAAFTSARFDSKPVAEVFNDTKITKPLGDAITRVFSTIFQATVEKDRKDPWIGLVFYYPMEVDREDEKMGTKK